MRHETWGPEKPLRDHGAGMKQGTRFMENKVFKNKSGFTLAELLITLAIIILIVGAVFVFQQDLFRFNQLLTETFSIEEKAQSLLRNMVKESRTAAQSNSGGYAIEIADNYSFAFYANIDKDTLKERIHYFLDGTDFKKSVVKPGGNPLTYSTTTVAEDLRTVLMDVVASTTEPIFSYFDKNYAGTTTPLAKPVNIADIRLVGIHLIVDKAPGLPPPIEISSSVTIRNLKDNL